MSFIDDIAEAIARQEGTGCGANNNPGNLRTWGALPVSRGFAVFPTCEAGWDALRHQVQRNVDRGLTLEEFFGGKTGVYPGYAPAADNNQPLLYARNVSTWSDLPLGVPLNQLSMSMATTEYYPDTVSNSTEFPIEVALLAVLGLAVAWTL